MERDEEVLMLWDFSKHRVQRESYDEQRRSFGKHMEPVEGKSCESENEKLIVSHVSSNNIPSIRPKRGIGMHVPHPPLSSYLLLLNLLFAGYMAILASGFASEKQTEAHIYDIAHEMLANVEGIWITFGQADMSVSISVISFVLWFLRGIFIHAGTQIEWERYRIFERWMFTYASVLWIRTISFTVTVIPDPDGACLSHVKNGKIDLLLPIRYALGQSYVCGDLIISGHVAATLSIVCAVRTVGAKVTSIINFLWISFSVLITKMHYTVDVILAVILVILIAPYYDRFFPEKKR